MRLLDRAKDGVPGMLMGTGEGNPPDIGSLYNPATDPDPVEDNPNRDSDFAQTTPEQIEPDGVASLLSAVRKHASYKE